VKPEQKLIGRPRRPVKRRLRMIGRNQELRANQQ